MASRKNVRSEFRSDDKKLHELRKQTKKKRENWIVETAILCVEDKKVESLREKDERKTYRERSTSFRSSERAQKCECELIEEGERNREAS